MWLTENTYNEVDFIVNGGPGGLGARDPLFKR